MSRKQIDRRRRHPRKHSAQHADFHGSDNEEDLPRRPIMSPDSYWKEIRVQKYLRMRMKKGLRERESIWVDGQGRRVTLAERILRFRVNAEDKKADDDVVKIPAPAEVGSAVTVTEPEPESEQETKKQRFRTLLQKYVKQREEEEQVSDQLIEEINRAKAGLRDSQLLGESPVKGRRSSSTISLGDSATNINIKSRMKTKYRSTESWNRSPLGKEGNSINEEDIVSIISDPAECKNDPKDSTNQTVSLHLSGYDAGSQPESGESGSQRNDEVGVATRTVHRPDNGISVGTVNVDNIPPPRKVSVLDPRFSQALLSASCASKADNEKEREEKHVDITENCTEGTLSMPSSSHDQEGEDRQMSQGCRVHTGVENTDLHVATPMQPVLIDSHANENCDCEDASNREQKSGDPLDPHACTTNENAVESANVSRKTHEEEERHTTPPLSETQVSNPDTAGVVNDHTLVREPSPQHSSDTSSPVIQTSLKSDNHTDEFVGDCRERPYSLPELVSTHKARVSSKEAGIHSQRDRSLAFRSPEVPETSPKPDKLRLPDVLATRRLTHHSHSCMHVSDFMTTLPVLTFKTVNNHDDDVSPPVTSSCPCLCSTVKDTLENTLHSVSRQQPGGKPWSSGNRDHRINDLCNELKSHSAFKSSNMLQTHIGCDKCTEWGFLVPEKASNLRFVKEKPNTERVRTITLKESQKEPVLPIMGTRREEQINISHRLVQSQMQSKKHTSPIRQDTHNSKEFIYLREMSFSRFVQQSLTKDQVSKYMANSVGETEDGEMAYRNAGPFQAFRRRKEELKMPRLAQFQSQHLQRRIDSRHVNCLGFSRHWLKQIPENNIYEPLSLPSVHKHPVPSNTRGTHRRLRAFADLKRRGNVRNNYG